MRRSGGFTEQTLIDGRDLDAAARRVNADTGTGMPGFALLAGQSLTPVLRSEIENRLAERAAMRDLFIADRGQSTAPSVSAAADANMTDTYQTVRPAAARADQRRRTGFSGTKPIGPGSVQREVEHGTARAAQAADASADRRYSDDRLQEMETRAREETSIDRKDEATNRSSTAAVGGAAIDEIVETGKKALRGWRKPRE